MILNIECYKLLFVVHGQVFAKMFWIFGRHEMCGIY